MLAELMPHVVSQQTRRNFLKISGATLGGIAVGSTVTAATSTDRFIVKSNKVSQADLESSSLEVVHDLSVVDILVVRGSETDVEALDGEYAPDLAYSLNLPIGESPITGSESSARDEPYYPLQWDKQVQDIPAVHDITRGEGTRVAVIDTGVDPTHPDLQHAVNTGLSRNFTDDGGTFVDSGYHGTHVSGIIASNDQNEAGVVGSAPATDLVACRVFEAAGGAMWGDILAAMVYAAEIDADVANLSLGAYPVPKNDDFGEFYGGTLQKTGAYVRRQGTLLVAAAGNDAADLQHDGNVISLPNESPHFMSISATGPVGFNWGDEGLEEPYTTPAVYTNYGKNAIDVSAPGGNYDPEFPVNYYYDMVYNTIPTWYDDGYGWLAGTSMAAPQVAAAAALVKSVNPGYNANQVEKTLRNTANRVGDKAYHGKGFLDPLEAVQN